MDCMNFSARLGEWLDGSLDAAASQEMHAHAEQCLGCGAERVAEHRLRAALRSLPMARPRPGFVREAMRLARLRNGARDHAGRGRDAWFALAGATAAAIGMAAVLWLRPPGPDADAAVAVLQAPSPAAAEVRHKVVHEGMPTFVMTIGDVESVRLRIDAPRDFDDVRFSMDLPDHVSMADQPGIRAMTWSGQLRKGENVLELPLIAQSGAAGVMTARVSYGLQEQRLQTRLIGSDAGAEGTAPSARLEGT